MKNTGNDIPPSCHVYGIKCDKTKEECHEHINQEGEKMETTSEGQPVFRYRINSGISVKGVITFDCTVEGTGSTMEEVLEKHDELFGQLSDRYSDQQSFPEVR